MLGLPVLSRSHSPSSLKVIPLGGVGAFGMNMMLFEYEEQIVIVDAGFMFPNRQLPGIDVVIPNFTYLRKPTKQILGIFLTHAHMDHIGALPYLLREMNVPIYGAPLTLAFLSDRLREHRKHLCVKLSDDLPPEGPQEEPQEKPVNSSEAGEVPPASAAERLRLIPMAPREQVTLGPFCVEAIAVTHSIADSVGYAITTPVGCVIHTGDFKIDSTPVQGPQIDMQRFTEYGDRGVLLLVSDSTNAERAGVSGSEAVVGETFDRLFPEIAGRIVVATFASHLSRMEQVAQSARRSGRKIFLTGKSLLDAIRIGHQVGHLSFAPEQVLSLKQLSQTPDREVVILTTGSQGEPASALYRMAMDDHKQVCLQPGDTVILSARAIPSNEEAVSRVINTLLRKGVRVLYDKIAPVHVSGHANRDEQRQMIAWTRPRYFMPVHGEWRQMVAHAGVAHEAGMTPERVILAENGDTLFFAHDHFERGKPVLATGVYVDASGVGNIEESTLLDRLQMGEEGIVGVVLTVDGTRILPGPRFFSRGFVGESRDLPIWKDLEETVETLLLRVEREPDVEVPASTEEIIQKIRKAIKKRLTKKWNRHPLLHVQTSSDFGELD
jgi:ribonuclease J